MAPPELPADAPVALLAEPVEVALGVAFGVDPDRPEVTASIASWAQLSSIRTNHWSDR